MAAKRKAGSRKNGTKPGAGGAFVCPDCGFVAKHAMGLGRHRSARHGALSLRAQRERASGKSAGRASAARQSSATPSGWLTRREAAATGGVHYNTVRLWERAGKLRTRQRGRETLVNAVDLRKVIGQKGARPVGRPAGSSAARPASTSAPNFEATELLARLDALADGLEALARQVRPRKRRGRPPKR